MDDKKTSSSVPSQWDEVYHLGDLGNSHKTPKINVSFSRLLNKPVSTSRYVSLSLDNSAKLEACIRGQIESQSFSLWALAVIFGFLKDSNCVPDGAVFHQLVSSMMSINSQARASFSAAAFLKQKCQQTLMSHLPPSAHASVKQALLSTPSTSSLFAEDVIKESLTQVKEDFQIKLLMNLSSLKGGKQSASTASSSGWGKGSSSSLSSSKGSSQGSRHDWHD